ncbi:MAG: prolyl oligopeptidase family serine peptidase [Bryobacterales bacterium]|nr:prolyl oligopeptidase family serine peptidase [Bryobacterales bacterium]
MKLSRRDALSAIGFLSAAPQIWAQRQAGLYRDYSRCLPDFLGGLAQQAVARRGAELDKLTSVAAVEARKRWIREMFWKLVGGEPQRTPLNARTTGTLDRDGYRVEKVVYESQPGFHISANLYVPTAGRPPFPGVLFQMGHALDGKASPLYQRCCQGLVKLGFVVLAFDPMGQGERTYYPGARPSLTRLGSADDEHTVPARQMMLLGDSSARMQTWDAVRSLDYLASLPYVDRLRLASTGQSGGGTNTMLLAAVDDRLACAAIACPNTENVAVTDFHSPGSTDDAEQNFPGSGPVGFDRWDLLYPLAAKPLLVALSERDFFGTYSPQYLVNGREEYARLGRVYEVLGRKGQLAWFSTPLPHGLAYEMRLAIYRWFRQWLQPGMSAVNEEPGTEPETESALFVSDSGNLVRSFGGESPFTLNRKRLAVARPASSGVDLRSLLGVDPVPVADPAAAIARTEFRHTMVEAIEVQPADKVWVPAYVFRPKRGAPKEILLVLEPGGRNLWREDEMYDLLAQQGYVVCAPDLRGIGDMTPEFGRGAARHARSHNSDEHYAWSGLTFGKPMAGQRVSDILSLVAGLRARSDFGRLPLHVAARGMLTVPALFAASIEPAIQSLYLAGGLISYRNLAETENYNHPMSNFVPRLLLHTDLPEVAAGMAPRRIVLAGTVNGAGERADSELVKNAYPGAHVVVRDRAEWTVEALTGRGG